MSSRKKKKSTKKVTSGAAPISKLTEWELSRGTVDEFREKYRLLRQENEKLKEELRRDEQDTVEVIAYLRKEGDTKDERIQLLTTQLNHQQADFEKEKNMVEAQWKSKNRVIEEKLNKREANFLSLQSELDIVKDFIKNRQQLLNQMDAQKKEMEAMQRAHQEHLSRVEHKFYEEKVRLQKEMEESKRGLMKQAREEAVRNLDEREKQVLIENVQMAQELRVQVQETDDLQRTRKLYEEENKRLQREAELSEAAHTEYARQGRDHLKEIRGLMNKIKALEQTLGQVVRGFDKERTQMNEQFERERTAYETQVTRLRRALRLKLGELRNIRGLAKFVLSQRTDLERFLSFGLEEVRAQTVSQPERATEAKLGGQPQDEGGVVRRDISELSWADVEAVLRLCFAKINMSRNQEIKLKGEEWLHTLGGDENDDRRQMAANDLDSGILGNEINGTSDEHEWSEEDEEADSM